MIYKKDIFNRRSISVFTDASSYVTKHDNVQHVCSGYSIYVGDILVEQNAAILHGITVNQGELYGIKMGIDAAIRLSNGADHITSIRLFSDSQISVYAIRDRIYRWIERGNGCNLIGVEGQEIANIEYIMSIINTIMYYNKKIEFYHVKGHADGNSPRDLKKAKETFHCSNGINQPTDDNLIRQLCIGNDQVDRYTGMILGMFLESGKQSVTTAISSGYTQFDTDRYRYLTGGILNG